MRAGLAVVGLLAVGCARTGLRIDDAGTDAAAPDAPACVEAVDPPHRWCALDAPNSTVRGVTPLGVVDLPFAWAGYADACEVGDLWLGEAPRMNGEWTPRPGRPAMHVWGLPWEHGTDEWEVQVTVLAPGCREAETTGTLTLRSNPGSPGDDARGEAGRADGFCACDGTTFVDPPCAITGERQRVVAELRVRGDGWDLRGAIDAPQCHSLHSICF